MSTQEYNYFFNLMDVLEDWHNNYSGLELLNVRITKYYASTSAKQLLVIGNIKDSERDIKDLVQLAHRFPNSEDGRYFRKLSEWFDLGNPHNPTGEIRAFYQKCISVSSDSELVNVMNELESKCKDRYPDMDIKFELPKAEKGPCYIATSVYGTYDCPELWTLRRFRDNVLNKHFAGRIFIKIYYKTSPWLVKHFGHTKLFTKFIKRKLDKFIYILNEAGISNSDYNDTSI